MRMLKDATGYIQRAVAGTLRTRVTPELLFALDTSIDKSFKVAAILDEQNTDSADVTLRCRGGGAKRFRLHRRVDDYLSEVFIVAEERHSSVAREERADDELVQPLRPPMRLTR